MRTTNFNVTGGMYRFFVPLLDWSFSIIAFDASDWTCWEEPSKAVHSHVWLFSTLESEQSLLRYLKGNLSLALKVLVETAFVIHPWGHNATYQHCSSMNLWKIISFAGSQTLEGLEVALKTRHWRKLPRSAQGVISCTVWGLGCLRLLQTGAPDGRCESEVKRTG